MTKYPNGNHLFVERAIAELRASRPIRLSHPNGEAIVLPVDALDSAMLKILAEDIENPSRVFERLMHPYGREEKQGASSMAFEVRLVLSGPRLQKLGALRQKPGVLCVTKENISALASIAFGPHETWSEQVADLNELDMMGLDMVQLSLVLPAVLLFVPKSKNADLKEQMPECLVVHAADLNMYHRFQAIHLRLISRAQVPLEGALETEFVIFRGGEGLRDQVAVIIGQLDISKPVKVRLHSACLTGDLFGSLKCDCGDQLRSAAARMAKEGGGIILYLDQEGRGNGLSSKIHAYGLQAQGYDTYDADAILGFGRDQRQFNIAAEMLKKLGVKKIELLTNNPKKINALKAAKLDIIENERIFGRKTEQNVSYLKAKRDREGHLIDIDQLLDARREGV